jgi:hypothetical protein
VSLLLVPFMCLPYFGTHWRNELGHMLFCIAFSWVAKLELVVTTVRSTAVNFTREFFSGNFVNSIELTRVSYLISRDSYISNITNL